eukprot:18422-Heterococcus_DN1.PRE.4
MLVLLAVALAALQSLSGPTSPVLCISSIERFATATGQLSTSSNAGNDATIVTAVTTAVSECTVLYHVQLLISTISLIMAYA